MDTPLKKTYSAYIDLGATRFHDTTALIDHTEVQPQAYPLAITGTQADPIAIITCPD